MTSESPHSRGRARIINQRVVAEGYREMSLSPIDGELGHQKKKPLPGQFFTVLPHRYPVPLIRRPFAYSDSRESGFSFIYEIRGTGTQDLARLEAGAVLDLIGPLGSAFPQVPAGVRPILVAGGIGVGPILFLARDLAQTGQQPLIILGARNALLVPDLEWPSGTEIRICTDDGSTGIPGTVLDGLSNENLDDAVFFTCGPHPMMAAIHSLAESAGSRCWVSMEEIMACGVGACQGCVIPMTNDSDSPEYKRACVEGPIFDSREILW